MSEDSVNDVLVFDAGNHFHSPTALIASLDAYQGVKFTS
jgi:hypothetical protein